MPKSQTSPFDPLEMMDLRTKAGSVLDTVFDHRKRFIIRRKGTPKALLVPIEDKLVIEKAISDQQLDKMYEAIKRMEGMVDDGITDSSTMIDEVVYGEAYDQTQQEQNG